jgi:hypothetical protein
MIRPPLALTEDDVYEQTYTLLVRLDADVWRLAQKRASKQTPGLSDLLVFTRDNRAAFIETKDPIHGVQSRAQRRLQACCERCGIAYLLVDHPQQVADWLGATVQR